MWRTSATSELQLRFMFAMYAVASKIHLGYVLDSIILVVIVIIILILLIIIIIINKLHACLK